MPYIRQEYREIVENPLYDLWVLIVRIPKQDRAGVLTYIIYKLLIDLHINKFVDFATHLGILDTVGKEFYRKVIAPYEDEKIQENGDVV